ncbi:MAG: hypothetical protein ACKVPJ_11905 [Chitinophagales bacterium]
MNKLQEDSVFIGMFVSIFLTVTVFYALYVINQTVPMGRCESYCMRERFIATMAAFSNFFPFFIYMRVRKDNCMRGVGIITVLLAVFVMMFYYILGNTSFLT